MLSVPSLEMLTRIGFAARGIMYLIVGYLALRFGRSEGGSGALAYLAEGAGKAVLGVMALGFLAYGFWRLAEAIVDTEGHGTDAKGKAARAGGFVSGLVHLGLAFLAARLAFGRSGGSGSGAQEGAATALSLPGGSMLLIAVSAALLATGLWQLVKSVKGDFLRHLEAKASQRTWVMWLGRAGYAARGIVFLITGWFALQAGLSADAGKAGGMEQALSALSGTVLAAVALGLALFGLFSFVEARYRRINDPQVLARLGGGARARG